MIAEEGVLVGLGLGLAPGVGDDKAWWSVGLVRGLSGTLRCCSGWRSGPGGHDNGL